MVKSFKTLATALVAIVPFWATLVMMQLASSMPGVTHSKDLTDDLAVMAQISERRFQAIDALLGGRSSLKQTAATFRALSLECPYDPLPYLRILHPDYSDHELHYLHVIAYTRTVCRQRRMSEVVPERLREEFESLQRTGDVYLSDSAE